MDELEETERRLVTPDVIHDVTDVQFAEHDQDPTATHGYLMVKIGEMWGTVCNNGINYEAAHYFCERLGFLSASGISRPDHPKGYFYF